MENQIHHSWSVKICEGGRRQTEDEGEAVEDRKWAHGQGGAPAEELRLLGLLIVLTSVDFLIRSHK